MRNRRSASDILLLSLPVAFLATVIVAATCHAIPIWVSAGYVGGSVLTLAVYAWDKLRAQRGQWRIAESSLHGLEMLGGWPGALVAQRLFRHKTRKMPFQAIFWIIVVTHLAIWSWLIMSRI